MAVIFAVPSSGWTPASLGSSLVAWHIADAGVTLSGSNVTSWADQSGTGTTLSQGAGGTGPTYQATGFNSKPTISFSAATSDWLVTSSTVTFSNAHNISFFVVGQLLSGSTNNGRMAAICGAGHFDYGATDSICLIIDWGTTAAIGSYYNNVGYGSVATTFATDYRMGNILNGDSMTTTAYLNGAQQGSPVAITGTPAFSSAYYALGNALTGGSSGGAFCHCLISEVVLVNKILSGTEITSLDNYFKNKWGL